MSEEWLSAREARQMVAPGAKLQVMPDDPICGRAKVGLVRSKAALIVSTSAGATSEMRDHLIPKEFWGADALKQNWEHGVFSAWTSSEGWPAHWEAHGVAFAKSDIEAMVLNAGDRVASSQQPTAGERIRGGRPPKTNWEAVMIELARQLYVGDLNPKVQADVEKAIGQFLLDKNVSLAESTIRDHARPLWLAIRSEAENLLPPLSVPFRPTS